MNLLTCSLLKSLSHLPPWNVSCSSNQKQLLKLPSCYETMDWQTYMFCSIENANTSTLNFLEVLCWHYMTLVIPCAGGKVNSFHMMFLVEYLQCSWSYCILLVLALTCCFSAIWFDWIYVEWESIVLICELYVAFHRLHGTNAFWKIYRWGNSSFGPTCFIILSCSGLILLAASFDFSRWEDAQLQKFLYYVTYSRCVLVFTWGKQALTCNCAHQSSFLSIWQHEFWS